MCFAWSRNNTDHFLHISPNDALWHPQNNLATVLTSWYIYQCGIKGEKVGKRYRVCLLIWSLSKQGMCCPVCDVFPLLGHSLLHSAGCHWSHSALSHRYLFPIPRTLTSSLQTTHSDQRFLSLSLTHSLARPGPALHCCNCPRFWPAWPGLSGLKCSVVTLDPDISCSLVTKQPVTSNSSHIDMHQESYSGRRYVSIDHH